MDLISTRLPLSAKFALEGSTAREIKQGSVSYVLKEHLGKKKEKPRVPLVILGFITRSKVSCTVKSAHLDTFAFQMLNLSALKVITLIHKELLNVKNAQLENTRIRQEQANVILAKKATGPTRRNQESARPVLEASAVKTLPNVLKRALPVFTLET
jgi:hypothetical protein